MRLYDDKTNYQNKKMGIMENESTVTEFKHTIPIERVAHWGWRCNQNADMVEQAAYTGDKNIDFFYGMEWDYWTPSIYTVCIWRKKQNL